MEDTEADSQEGGETEGRTEMAGVALTPSEKREIRWLASVNETSISSLLRTMTPVEAVREAERKRAQLSASGSDAA